MTRSSVFWFAAILILILLTSACGSGASSSTDGDALDGDGEPSDGDEGDPDGDSPDGDAIQSDGDVDTDFDIDADESDGDGDTDGDSDPPVEVDCVELHGEGWAFNPSSGEGDGCKDCTTKICPPESATGIHQRTTLNGRCVCETKDGYFFSDTTYLPTPCDSDYDGWTTITAREFVESDDPALRDNARCDVRTVDRFILHPEEAGYSDVSVEIAPLPLYETNNRDDQNQLDLDVSRAPAYGDSGRRLRADELNSLTKFCVNPLADYNGNGVGDVAEWPMHEGLDPAFAEYGPFAYFGELNHGWYDPDDHAYHIAENSRTNGGALPQVPMVVDGGSAYWLQCRRLADAAYDPDEPSIGMDFAAYEGMFHHSQFKCLQVVDESDLNSREPQKVSVAQAAAGWIIDECAVPDETLPDGDLDAEKDDEFEAPGDGDAENPVEIPKPNPAYPDVECEDRTSVNVGDVGLALAEYINYTEEGGYTRGCVNECVEGWDGITQCNGYEAGTADCDTEVSQYGSGVCGCQGNYSYPACTSCINHYSPESNCTACYDTSEQGHWSGASCNVCRGNWNINTLCKGCVSHFTPASDCTACYNNDAQGHWTGTYCSACRNHYSLASGCKQCETNYTLASNCTDCSGNFDVDQNCSACLDNDTDGHWTGSSCDACRTNYYTGEFYSDNMVQNPNGNPAMTHWTPTSGSLMYGTDTGGSYISIFTTITSPMGLVTQDIQLSYALPVLTDPAYANARLKLQASMKTSNAPVSVTFEYYNRAYKKISETKLGEQSPGSWTTYGPQTLTLTEALRETRFVLVRLRVFGMSTFGYFRGISLTVEAPMATSQECRFCKYGFTDDPDTEGEDCLKCPSGILDTEHWNTSGCYMCADDNTNGHWNMPDCSGCSFLWSGLGCNVCLQGTFEKDSADQCSKSGTVVSNGGAEDLDLSQWNSNIPLTRHTSLHDIDAAAKGQYFFSMTDAGGEKSPYAEQRITVSQTIRDAVSAGTIGYVVISTYLAAHTDSDSPTLKVYQVTTAGGSGSQCGSSLSTNSDTWIEISTYCAVNTSVKEIRVRLEGENDNGGACNAYWDDIQVFFSAKLPELL